MHRAIWKFSLAPLLAICVCTPVPIIAQTIATNRIPASLAMEAASEVVSSCAAQGYNETAVVVDADGVTIAALRGDGTGRHTLDSARDKAYTAASFKRDTLGLSTEYRDCFARQTAARHVFWRGCGCEGWQ